MAQTPEGSVKVKVKRALHACKIFPFPEIAQGLHPDAIGFYWMPVQGQFAVRGVHDFVACVHGIFCSLETKAPDNSEDETMHQGWFRVAARQTGGISLTGVRDGAEDVDRMMQLVMEKLHADET